MPNQNSTLTSANAVFMLAIAGIFTAPQQLQGFSADNIFDVGEQETNQALMGVDGRLSAGRVFAPVTQTINLQADSASNNVFDTWNRQEKLATDTYLASANVYLKSIGTEFVLSRGVLTSYSPMPNAGKILQPRRFVITWERVQAVEV